MNRQKQTQYVNKKSTEDLIKEAYNYDRDIKIMAANDLCDRLQNQSDSISEDLQQKMCKVFLDHLIEQSMDIQSNAVRCIGQVVSKINQKQLNDVVQTLIDQIINGKKDIKDIFSTCIRTVIFQSQELFASVICDNLVKNSIIALQKSQQDSYEQIVDILDQVFKKFPIYMFNNQDSFNLQFLWGFLLQKIQDPTKSIRKPSCSCLGSLSVILNNQKVIQICQQVMDYPRENSQQLLYNFQALNQIVKQSHQKLVSTAKIILQMVLNQLKQMQNQEFDDFDYQNELIENLLQIILSFVSIQLCKQEVQLSKEIYDICVQMMHHDPNSAMEFDDDIQIENENDCYDDYYEDQVFNDSSWKVRRMAIQILKAYLLLKNQDIHHQSLDSLMQRVNEKDENVKHDALDAVEDGIFKVFDQNQPTQIFSKCIQILKKPQTTQGIVQKTSSLMMVMVSCSQFSLTSLFRDLIDLVFEHLQTQNPSSHQISTLLLNVLNTFFNVNQHNESVFNQSYQQIVQIVQISIKHEYYMICVKGFYLLSNLYKILKLSSQNTQNYDIYVKPQIQIIIQCMGNQTLDSETKSAAIENIGQLLCEFGHLIATNDLHQILGQLHLKLQNDLTHLSCLKVLKLMPLTIQTNAQIFQDFELIFEKILSFLNKQNRNLVKASIESLQIILKIIQTNIKSNLLQQLMSNLGPFINDQDFYLAQQSMDLIGILLDSQQNYNIPIDQLIDLSQSHIVQGSILQSLIKVFQKLVQKKLIDPEQYVKRLVGLFSKQTILPLSQIIAILVISSNENSKTKLLNEFIQSINSQKNDHQHLELSLLVIKEIANYINLFNHSQLVQNVTSLFLHENEDVKIYASQCLGGISIVDKDFILNLLKDKQYEKHKYLLLNSLKEQIMNSNQIYNGIDLINFIFNFCENGDDSMIDLTAECVGRLSKTDFKSRENLLIENMGSLNKKRKLVAASCFKHIFQSGSTIDLTKKTIDSLLLLTIDQDINITKAAIQSINLICSTNCESMKESINNTLFQSILKNLKLREDLVKVVDLGSFKHHVDDGLPTRLSAYVLTQTLLNNFYEKIDAEFLIQGILQSGLQDQNEDIQGITISCILKLAQHQNQVINYQLDIIVEQLLKSIERFVAKNYQLATKKDGDFGVEFIRKIRKSLDAINVNNSVEIQHNVKFKNFYSEFKSHELLKNIL